MNEKGQWGVLLLVAALIVALKAKRASEQPPTGGGPIGPPASAKPAVELVNVAFEGSPQATRITKRPGENFTAIILLKNPTEVQWTYDVSLRFGELAFWPAWTTEPTMPILMGRVTVPAGATRSLEIPHQVPETAKVKVYDLRIEVQVEGKGIEGGIADLEDRFTVETARPAVSVLQVSWI